ncbi:MAG: hypothetical protein ACR2P1_20605 [Pseudomonadales bacterium]
MIHAKSFHNRSFKVDYVIFVLTLIAALTACGGGSGGSTASTPPTPEPAPTETTIDLASFTPSDGLTRLSGSASTGRFGVPVAAGIDCDGDGNQDYAMSGMQAAPFTRTGAGQVWLVLGDGTIGANIDSATNNANIVIFAGSANAEAAGGEIWMDDVTGDGIGDLIIGRFNYRNPMPDRIGAGALTVVVGGPELRDLGGGTVDLAAPPAQLTVFTLVGAAELDRLAFWMRTGDISGDGIADIVFGADQADVNGNTNAGLAYVVRGGPQLVQSTTIDLASISGSILDGHIATLLPPANANNFHFGATVAVTDLDGNGRGEVIVAASLARIGGMLVADSAPESSATRFGGNIGGSLFIVWDDNVPASNPWPSDFSIDVANPVGSLTRIDGGEQVGLFTSERFGEDVLGGEDYDADGSVDIYVGDITGDRPNAVDAGLGHVFFNAATLKNRQFSLTAVPGDIRMTTILGASPGAISADTSVHGDIDADGIVDLVIASPLDDPENRADAGAIHVLWGQPGPWPDVIDLSSDRRPDQSVFAITDIFGARGRTADDDQGDTLMYSAAAGDINGDGSTDVVVNEMRGNGVAAGALDVGNLLVIDGMQVPRP